MAGWRYYRNMQKRVWNLYGSASYGDRYLDTVILSLFGLYFGGQSWRSYTISVKEALEDDGYLDLPEPNAPFFYGAPVEETPRTWSDPDPGSEDWIEVWYATVAPASYIWPSHEVIYNFQEVPPADGLVIQQIEHWTKTWDLDYYPPDRPVFPPILVLGILGLLPVLSPLSVGKPFGIELTQKEES